MGKVFNTLKLLFILFWVNVFTQIGLEWWVTLIIISVIYYTVYLILKASRILFNTLVSN